MVIGSGSTAGFSRTAMGPAADPTANLVLPGMLALSSFREVLAVLKFEIPPPQQNARCYLNDALESERVASMSAISNDVFGL